jgi:hypothetical protein
MTSEDLTTKQAEKIYDALRPTLGFLTQLEQRLQEIGFSPNDGYYEKVNAALDAFRRLTIETRRRSMTRPELPPRP